ncbi:hypothetical protein [Streptomyces albipurpureus]|uniref:Uncharacterized protein n=1 Tax=Streptomyces albipurpureus TaxID=2897419 RepID=A0ABT0UML8_9ACTN|nr:hypothetical protein [Streptomyces sp. CWNU-1]MCM2389862.1 hypothetical protein [Streptomyces sp. CWNU-1]
MGVIAMPPCGEVAFGMVVIGNPNANRPGTLPRDDHMACAEMAVERQLERRATTPPGLVLPRASTIESAI